MKGNFMKKIVFLIGVLFLNNTYGMYTRELYSPSSCCYWTEEKGAVVLDALNDVSINLRSRDDLSELYRSDLNERLEYAINVVSSVGISCYIERSLQGRSKGERYISFLDNLYFCLGFASEEKREKAIKALDDMGYNISFFVRNPGIPRRSYR
jgi:hypothetical protein